MIEPCERSPRDIFVTQLPLIERLIAGVTRRRRLSGADAEDFASIVRLRLLENNCRVLRQFRGRASIATFLAVVIERCYLDYRTACWGRWRPSTIAKRLGPLAIALERLIIRDRLSTHEACETLRINHKVDVNVTDLTAVVPHLRPRPQRVDIAQLDWLTNRDPDPETAYVSANLRPRTILALERALSRLGRRERQLLGLRFVEQLTVAEIARTHGFDQRVLYTELRRVLGQLRLDLLAQGVTRGDATARDYGGAPLSWSSPDAA